MLRCVTPDINPSGAIKIVLTACHFQLIFRLVHNHACRMQPFTFGSQIPAGSVYTYPFSQSLSQTLQTPDN